MKKTQLWYSKWEYLFYIVSGIIVLGIGAYVYFRVTTYLTTQDITEKKITLDNQNKQLQNSKNMTGYQKLISARQILSDYERLLWSEHIPKLVAMLEEIKEVDPSESSTVELSDFTVNLEEISLKGKVSSLKLLYKTRRTSTGKIYKSLIDKFADLGFLSQIRIQSYKRSGRAFEFVLTAKVSTNEWK